MTMKISVKQVEKAIGIPSIAWIGNCYSISYSMVQSGIVEGKAVYGHWTGPISKYNPFYSVSQVGFCRHGWIIKEDGEIVDPTRWVFEGKTPYIYVGKNDYYDEGGNNLRKSMTEPPPQYSKTEKQFSLNLDKKTLDFVNKLLGYSGKNLSMGQLFWLANLSLVDLGEHAKDIYYALEEKGMAAAIPLDNQRKIL
jgi:hypothetical protein